MRKYLIAVILFLLLIGTVCSYSNLNNIKYANASFLEKREYTPVINVSGKFENSDKTDIFYGFPLCIKDVYVKQNSYVNKGQALFSIDKSKMASSISDGANREIVRLLSMDEANKINNSKSTFSPEELLSVPDVIYSPENGIINSVSIFPESISLPNQILMTIGQSDKIIAKFSLSQQDFGRINIGDRVYIKPVAFNQKNYYGNISEDSALIKTQTSLSGSKTVVEVFATIDNTDYLVYEGLDINGVIYCGPAQEINTLNYNFIYQDDNMQYVYVLDNGKAKRTNIETGIETDTYTEVLTPFDSDTIFLSGDISDGDRVIVIE